ncbi:MAG: response regulator, partial [Clostridiales bacterium]|nr:response regulator [Clostridiales bacterium]
MKTLFIADDELNIREGLKCILDWEQLGYQLCGEASNGEDALKEIIKKNPNLVLLDIRMPKTYGTDVIKLSREQGFTGKFIILSGYSDFTYAQTAIKYGVDFYLTKPIDEDELLQAVNKITLALEAEKKNTENIELFKEKAKNVILHEIVTGTFEGKSTTMLSDADYADMNLDADIYQVVIYENFSTNLNETSYPFEDLLKITNKGNHTFEHFKEDTNEVILLKGQFALNKFEEFISHYEIQRPQKGSPLDTLFLAYGRPVKNIDEVYLSYEEASTLCKRRFFCMQGQHTLGYEELPAFSVIYQELSNEKLLEFSNLLIDYLQTFNRKKVAATLYSLEEYLYNIKSDISSVKLFLTDLYLQVKEHI